MRDFAFQLKDFRNTELCEVLCSYTMCMDI